jgi:hypothetical protein
MNLRLSECTHGLGVMWCESTKPDVFTDTVLSVKPNDCGFFPCVIPGCLFVGSPVMFHEHLTVHGNDVSSFTPFSCNSCTFLIAERYHFLSGSSVE